MRELRDLLYKGERSYLHGTDIFSSLYELLPIHNSECMNIRFISPSKNQLQMIEESELLGPHKQIAKITITGSQKTNNYFLIERNAEVNSRYKYDERILTEGCTVGKTFVSKKIDEDFTIVEYIVALNKLLLNCIVNSESVNKWFLTQLNFDHLPKREHSRQKVKLDFKQAVADRYFKSTISIDGDKIGEIFFALIREER